MFDLYIIITIMPGIIKILGMKAHLTTFQYPLNLFKMKLAICDPSDSELARYQVLGYRGILLGNVYLY